MPTTQKILKGRYAATAQPPFVVFLIGIRINRLLAVNRWWPTIQAMPRMLKALEADPDSGMLGYRSSLYWRGAQVTQYWRSFEDLERFARDTKGPHWPAWKRFYQAARDDGSVGIWHETYRIEPGGYETIYGNMPAFGLGAAMGAAELKDLRRARVRLKDSAPEAASENEPS